MNLFVEEMVNIRDIKRFYSCFFSKYLSGMILFIGFFIGFEKAFDSVGFEVIDYNTAEIGLLSC
jgi:hypothetical protein